MYMSVTEYPPDVVNAGSSLASDVLKEKINQAALIIKTTYWSVVLCTCRTHTHSRALVIECF